jgi:predicted metal-dependent enzyme (double-stranded beta helix superfamily)
MSFDREVFVADCVSAATEGDACGAVSEAVRRQLGSGSSIDDAFRDAPPGPVTLHASPTLTVQRLEWLPGLQSSVHDHRMWAVVGVYGGAEHNSFYRRVDEGLEDAGGRVVEEGEALVLGAEVIHSVTNPSRRRVGGLHVYGGDIDGSVRSQWRPDGTEGLLAEVRPREVTMWRTVRACAQEQGRLSDDDLFDATSEINRVVAEGRRVLSSDEVRQALARLWAP